uniref:CSON004834 protein n=1 Tax=Culicoides sonorensis TaxID=179676 RepID=A0A336MP85_CULSO
MPGFVGVSDFVDDTKEDFKNPTISSFAEKIPQLKKTVNILEETIDFDREGLSKLKKATKAIINSGNSHVENEMCLVRALERLGSVALSKEEPDIGAAFLKFSVVTKELSALMKTLMQSLNNLIMFPVDSLLKSELRGAKGELKKPFEKASKEYDVKYLKIEKEKKAQAKEVGMLRSEVYPSEVADEMEKERRMFQLQMCEYLLKFNDIKTKKGIELLQHLIEYYHAQHNFFKDGLKTIEHFGTYIEDLSKKLQGIRAKQDEEKKKLVDLRLLLRSAPDLDRNELLVQDKNAVYSLHQLQGDSSHGTTKTGYLLKKSEGKMRKVWQRRKCEVIDGFLSIFHADELKMPTKVNLLTCQIKPVPDDKKCFDLISYNRLYHFQTEQEQERDVWISVLVNCKEKQLSKAFQHTTNTNLNPSLQEYQKTLIKNVQLLPGNDKCCDCASKNDVTWMSLNFGILVCIHCSGIHRELGVHYSRIQSLTLDNLTPAQLLIARIMGNNTFNEVFEATVGDLKIKPDCSMDDRYEYIKAKYVARRYILHTTTNSQDLMVDLEQGIFNADICQVLQAWAEGADLGQSLPGTRFGETALHLAVLQYNPCALSIVEFLIQHMNPAALNHQIKTSNDDFRSATALHLCAWYDRRECMKLLLRIGCDYTIMNENGQTALDIAREKKHDECVKLVLLP